MLAELVDHVIGVDPTATGHHVGGLERAVRPPGLKRATPHLRSSTVCEVASEFDSELERAARDARAIADWMGVGACEIARFTRSSRRGAQLLRSYTERFVLPHVYLLAACSKSGGQSGIDLVLSSRRSVFEGAGNALVAHERGFGILLDCEGIARNVPVERAPFAQPLAKGTLALR